MNKCIICNKEYEAKRSTSKYCSEACKQNAKRNRVSVSDDTSKVSVSCHSVLGDRYCSCGERIHAVLHPIGPHEVVLSFRTRHLYSIISNDYIPMNKRQSIDSVELNK